MEFYKALSHFTFFCTIYACSIVATWLSIKYLKIVDIPNERSSHVRITPRGGGIAIVFAFLLGISVVHFIGKTSPINGVHFSGLFISALMISLISFYDDWRGVPALFKLAGYLLAVGIALIFGILIDELNLPYWGKVELGMWGYLLTFFWIFGLVNTINFMDGLDGIATSTTMIAALFFSYIAFDQGSHFIYLASLILAAACLGFLFFNWPPARIFMGDVGSTFLGLTFAVMAIIAARYDHSHTSFFVVPMLLFHFIFDVAFTFFRRLLAREKVLQGHRTHLYQLINRMGWPHRRVTMLYSGVAIVQGGAAQWAVNGSGGVRWLIFIPLLLLYASCALLIIRRARISGLLQGHASQRVQASR